MHFIENLINPNLWTFLIENSIQIDICVKVVKNAKDV